MAIEFETLQGLAEATFDTLVDVRSPAEYAEDHIPGAINLPVLDNDERARVGTVYVQQSPFLARKIGAALVFRNAARHVETRLMQHDGSWRPLVYCWRGGQRSGSFAWMLGQIGWRADTVAGGYRSYRRLVKRRLYDDPLGLRLVLLDGYTGTAKTELLHLLRSRGVQVLDLEGMAGHRGSLLGALDDPQPSQKAFESRLAQEVIALDPARPVVVEAESSKIGSRIVPPALWTAMKAAPRIEIDAPVAERAAYLVRAYGDVLSDPPMLRTRLAPLRAYRGGAVVDGWFDLIESGDKTALTRALMVQHYDPAYDKSRTGLRAEPLARLATERLDSRGLDDLASRVAAAVENAGLDA